MFATFADRIDYPMLVVTAEADGERSGCLVGFASQVSIDPARYMVLLSKRNRTYDVARRASALAVHAIPAERRDVAELFGGTTGYDVDKLAEVRWTHGPANTALIDACPLRFVGSILRTDELGDHVGFTLTPLPDDGGPAPAGPLLTFQQVRDLTPGREA